MCQNFFPSSFAPSLLVLIATRMDGRLRWADHFRKYFGVVGVLDKFTIFLCATSFFLFLSLYSFRVIHTDATQCCWNWGQWQCKKQTKRNYFNEAWVRREERRRRGANEEIIEVIIDLPSMWDSTCLHVCGQSSELLHKLLGHENSWRHFSLCAQTRMIIVIVMMTDKEERLIAVWAWKWENCLRWTFLHRIHCALHKNHTTSLKFKIKERSTYLPFLPLFLMYVKCILTEANVFPPQFAKLSVKSAAIVALCKMHSNCTDI